MLTTDMTKATAGAQNHYLLSSTTFNTPTSTDPQVLQQLGTCQAQFLFRNASPQINIWALADVGVSYVGPMAVTASAP